MRCLIPFFAGVGMLFGCGGNEALSAGAVVKEWGEAINARDWERACELSVRPQKDCEDSLRGDYARARLTFGGVAGYSLRALSATNGGELKESEESFFFGGNIGMAEVTVVVTAVPKDGGFRVRVEAIGRAVAWLPPRGKSDGPVAEGKLGRACAKGLWGAKRFSWLIGAGRRTLGRVRDGRTGRLFAEDLVACQLGRGHGLRG